MTDHLEIVCMTDSQSTSISLACDFYNLFTLPCCVAAGLKYRLATHLREQWENQCTGENRSRVIVEALLLVF